MDVQTGLALYWWQWLITFGFGRIRVKLTIKIKGKRLLLSRYTNKNARNASSLNNCSRTKK